MRISRWPTPHAHKYLNLKQLFEPLIGLVLQVTWARAQLGTRALDPLVKKPE